jgi:hypothetical protein
VTMMFCDTHRMSHNVESQAAWDAFHMTFVHLRHIALGRFIIYVLLRDVM